MPTIIKLKDVAASRGIASFTTYTKEDFKFLLMKYSFVQELESFFKKIPVDTIITEDSFSWIDYEDRHQNYAPAVFTTNNYMTGFYLLYKGMFSEAMEHFEQLGEVQ